MQSIWARQLSESRTSSASKATQRRPKAPIVTDVPRGTFLSGAKSLRDPWEERLHLAGLQRRDDAQVLGLRRTQVRLVAADLLPRHGEVEAAVDRLGRARQERLDQDRHHTQRLGQGEQ